jgi:hypothetical protein
MKRQPELNLAVINNFILFLTHVDNYETELEFKEVQEYTPEQLYQAAKYYIKEDHIDGYDHEQEYCIQLWLDAEEANRNGELKKAFLLKIKFSKAYEKLWGEAQDYVSRYLEDIGG